MSLETFDEQLPILETISIWDTNTTVPLNGVTAVGRGKRYHGATAASTDTVAAIVDVFVYNGSTTYIIGSVAVPANAGDGTVAIVDVFAAILPANVGGINLPSGYYLKWAVRATLSVGKNVSITLHGGQL